MKKMTVDLIIESEDKKEKYENISANLKNNKLVFEDDLNKYIFDFDKNNFIKENEESKIIFNYEENKKSMSTYYIKELDFYIDMKVLTNSINIDNNNVKIDYEVYLNDELSGKFNLLIKMR